MESLHLIYSNLNDQKSYQRLEIIDEYENCVWTFNAGCLVKDFFEFRQLERNLYKKNNVIKLDVSYFEFFMVKNSLYELRFLSPVTNEFCTEEECKNPTYDHMLKSVSFIVRSFIKTITDLKHYCRPETRPKDISKIKKFYG